MRRTILFSAAAVTLLGCASFPKQMASNGPETCITIDNREGGRLGRVHLASDGYDAIPLILKTIEPGGQERHCVNQSGLVGNWWLESRDADLSFRARPPRLGIRRVGGAGEHIYVSPDFYFEAGSEIRWDTYHNYIYVNGMRIGGL